MTNTNDARKAHDLLDELDARAELSQEQEKLLRSFLPELPKQMTLEEIIIDVRGAWTCTSGNDWGGNICKMDVSIEDWLGELHAQLKGLMDTPVTSPALPAGMRLADHEEYGRVVVSSKPNDIGQYKIFHLDDSYVSGADVSYVEADALTFIDAEPAKPVHPEFLETEADYEKAPEGTIVGDYLAPSKKKPEVMWQKLGDGKWWFVGGSHYASMPDNTRNVIRWGRGE